MAEQRWTVVVVPHGASESRAIAVSRRRLRWSIGVLGTVAAAVIAFGYVAISKSINLAQLDRLERRNQLLRAELDEAHRLLRQLSDTVGAIALRDQQVRLLAGLEPTDPDVLLAGVGGPSGMWTERERLLSEGATGRAALSFRADLNTLIRRANLLAGSYREALDSVSTHVDLLKRTPSINPISPTRGWITSHFAQVRMHPIFQEPRPHEGIDIYAPVGTPIVAPAAGRVVDVRPLAGYGKTVKIDHGNGVVTFYAHASKVLVRVGQPVSRNDVIAEVGNTGTVTGPHLHYEVLVNGKPRNPLDYIFPASIVD
ncbi:MAG: M23 family metallopeptidase [Gemmatimonadales bacterium]